MLLLDKIMLLVFSYNLFEFCSTFFRKTLICSIFYLLKWTTALAAQPTLTLLNTKQEAVSLFLDLLPLPEREKERESENYFCQRWGAEGQ